MSNSDGLYGHWVTDCLKRGTKLISVALKMAWLGTKAELHLPLRPGTDAALAMGMLREGGNVGFQIATGRIELWFTYFNQVGMDPVPSFEGPTPGPVANPDMYKDYPLILTTGARNWTLFHSEYRQVPKLRSYRPDPIIQLNPATAEKYGLAEGDWVWVENLRGRAKRKVEFCEGLDPRHCSTDHGWWLPESGKYEEGGFSGMWDFNITSCSRSTPESPGSARTTRPSSAVSTNAKRATSTRRATRSGTSRVRCRQTAFGRATTKPS